MHSHRDSSAGMFTSAGLLAVAILLIIHPGTPAQEPTNIDVDLLLNVASCGVKNSVNIRVVMKENNATPGLIEVTSGGVKTNTFPTLEACTDKIGPLSYVDRSGWNATKLADELNKTILPAQFMVVADGGDQCSTLEDCIDEMHNFQRNDEELGYNFYFGGDGKIYEGLGWDLVEDGYGGLGETTISVRFIGLYQSHLPPQPAIDAFNKLTTIGMCSGKLSQTYKLISLRQFYDEAAFPSDKLDLALRQWEHWTEDISPEKSSVGMFPVITREEWNASEAIPNFESLWSPLRYVVVSDGGSRCFTAEGCLERIQEEQKENIDENGDVTDNFYVADNGYVYEGRGWDLSSDHVFTGIEKFTIGVKFFGSFKTYLPSKKAVAAFNKLLKFGSWLGKLSPEYKLLSIRKFTEDTDLLGYRLHEDLKTWKRYSKHI